ncbi:hypothetical protein DY000_02047425 [Brassica cretica]|uniref:Uncharacterized protein n=1 Tax=Brassica cretica TaxID=69181 RepID=A0ABQ7ENA3_BRACR|nr:hypothetical protein DY000_02047425 [Brassica cretica]
MFSTRLRSSSKTNHIKQSLYVTVMPFTNQVIFSSREFRPPEKLEMANLLSEEPMTNSIMPKVKMFEAEQRRLFSQFEVREFCDNLVEGVVKALKDVSKIQKKSTTTRAPIAKPSLFINEKPKDYCKTNLFATGASEYLVLFSQDFEQKPFDYPHQGPLLDTRRPLDDGLGPIFDEEDELGPTFDEKTPSMTSINMENHLCFDPGTTPTPLTTYIQEHCEKLDLINFLSESDINSGFVLSFDQFLKHSKGFDHFEESLELDLQQPDFCARNTFDSFVFKENSFNLSCYRYALITGNLFASTCALDEFMVKTLLEHKSLRAKSDFCCDSVLKSDLEVFADPWISNFRFEIDLLCSKSEKLVHVLNLFFSNCAITCSDTILVYNTYFDRLHDDLKRVLHVLGKETLVSDLNKYLCCTYDPSILMFVLSVQDKQDQSPRGVRNISRDHAYKFEIWRWKYLRKTTSKLQGSKWDLRLNPFQEGGNDVPLGSAPSKTDMHGFIMGDSKDICSLFDSYLPNHEASTHEEESDQTEFICDSYAIYK